VNCVCFVLLLFGCGKNLGRHTLVGTTNPIKKPGFAVTRLFLCNAFDTGIVQLFLLGTRFETFLPNLGHWIHYFIIARLLFFDVEARVVITANVQSLQQEFFSRSMTINHQK
jgi:hypothetical protein